jgi:hypothetical protein
MSCSCSVGSAAGPSSFKAAADLHFFEIFDRIYSFFLGMRQHTCPASISHGPCKYQPSETPRPMAHITSFLSSSLSQLKKREKNIKKGRPVSQLHNLLFSSTATQAPPSPFFLRKKHRIFSPSSCPAPSWSPRRHETNPHANPNPTRHHTCS